MDDLGVPLFLETPISYIHRKTTEEIHVVAVGHQGSDPFLPSGDGVH